MEKAAYTAETLNIEIKDNYAIVQLNNGKVNAINTPLLKDLEQIFPALDKDDAVKGVILAGRPHVFSAGLDVMGLATMNGQQMVDFWETYMHVMQNMVNFSKPLVCAMTGYAPAGATIFALLTDYRIMGKGAKHVVGMHEFKMSMQIPEMLCDVYAYHLGEVKSWKAVQQARLFNSDEALAEGLVDESVEVEEVMGQAEKHLKKLMRVHPKVYAQSKKWMRRQLHKIVLERDVPAIARETVEFNNDPQLQAYVIEFMMSLRKKKA
ncbi:MAG: enoyl-CoA hydratase/isomerase family protein [Saprospiraceae bacterium]